MSDYRIRQIHSGDDGYDAADEGTWVLELAGEFKADLGDLGEGYYEHVLAAARHQLGSDVVAGIVPVGGNADGWGSEKGAEAGASTYSPEWAIMIADDVPDTVTLHVPADLGTVEAALSGTGIIWTANLDAEGVRIDAATPEVAARIVEAVQAAGLTVFAEVHYLTGRTL